MVAVGRGVGVGVRVGVAVLVGVKVGVAVGRGTSSPPSSIQGSYCAAAGSEGSRRSKLPRLPALSMMGAACALLAAWHVPPRQSTWKLASAWEKLTPITPSCTVVWYNSPTAFTCRRSARTNRLPCSMVKVV